MKSAKRDFEKEQQIREKRRVYRAAYVAKNRDKLTLYWREYQQINKVKRRAAAKRRVLSAQRKKRKYDRARRLLKGDALREYDRTRYSYRRLEIERNLLGRAKQRAKKLGLPFNLKKGDLILPEVCPVLGITLHVNEGSGGRFNSPSLDKIIPSLGYVKGNVAVISTLANSIKHQGTPAQIRAVADWLEKELALRIKKS